jgi:translation initiation factor 2D
MLFTAALWGLQECLLGGLQSLQDAELPILTSDFYSKHMLPAKPEGAELLLIPVGDMVLLSHSEGMHLLAPHGLWCDVAGVSVDIKKSSYKKLSKLLSTFEKKVCISPWRSAPAVHAACTPMQGQAAHICSAAS